MMEKKRRVYLDHNATTPVREEVVEVMLPWFTEKFGNASSLHFFGEESRKEIERSRAAVAGFMGGEPEEVIFTSGGTESDNLAIRGVLAAAGSTAGNHIITSSIEHPAVLRTCQDVEKQGVDVTYLPCGSSGCVDPDDVRKAIRSGTVLISVMAANNETGVIQPVEEIASIAREHGIVFHTDAVQAAGKIKLDASLSGADLVSISAHKFYGPKGIGALYIRRGTRLSPVMTGGHHESGLRAGTENIPAIAGFAEACRISGRRLKEEASRIEALRDRLEEGITSRLEEVFINGGRSRRVPNTSSVTVRYVEGEAMALNLSMLGFALSTGSACATGDSEPSHVLRSMGVDPADAQGALRISLGHGNSEDEIDAFIEAFVSVALRLRKMSPVRKS